MLNRQIIIQELKQWYSRTFGHDADNHAFLASLASYTTKQLDRLLDKLLEDEAA